MPKLVTATMTKSLRAGKVFLDWSQNSAAKTTIAPYSLRGRDHPTVAAPRSWAELDDPDLRQLRYDEVLERVARDGDLLAELDDAMAVSDRLTTYRSMRDAKKTPEPVPAAKPATGNNNTFVIQEHHARRLHYDFRLERDGVLVSWAVPKNLPETTVGQPPRGAHRGSPAGVRDVRGLDPEGRVRRRQGDRLGLGHLRHREVPRR